MEGESKVEEDSHSRGLAGQERPVGAEQRCCRCIETGLKELEKRRVQWGYYATETQLHSRLLPLLLLLKGGMIPQMSHSHLPWSCQ